MEPDGGDVTDSLVSTTLPTLSDSHPRRLAEAWQEVDPDPSTRKVIKELLADDSTTETSAKLEKLFGSRLHFGTAGLRGPLGPGPNAMNRVLVRVVAASIGHHVLGASDNPSVAIGYDARHGSLDFAHDSARVLAKLGVDVAVIDRPTPTPVLAFAVRHLGASAGIMVTASHNPRTDNGYKVYGASGAQIRSPLDAEISKLIDALPLLTEGDLAELDDPRIALHGDDILSAYVEVVTGLLKPGIPRTARIAYTPLHGVGAETVLAAFAAAQFPAPAIVESQASPDPDFPTAAFPNPEEPGVLDPLLALATTSGADVALANDPDADRLAVAVPVGSSWKLLSGDEVGCLLAEHLLARRGSDAANALVINTVVSSTLLEKIATFHNARFVQTLTGFKWIMDARERHPDLDFVLGYEEALGYSVGEAVGDKDGVSAALIIAEMVSELAGQGRTMLDLLDDVHRRDGVHRSGQRSIRFESGGATPASAVGELRKRLPVEVIGRTVTSVQDLLVENGSLPSTDAIIINFDGGRVIVRPSGTEPKLKVYGETWDDPSATGLVATRAATHVRLQELLDSVVGMLADPEREQAIAALSRDDADTIGLAKDLFAMRPVGGDRARSLRLIMRCIDLTTLAGDDTPGRVRALCAMARRPDSADPTVGPTAAVCVYPPLVAQAVELTKNTGVKVASVAGAFPSGLSSLAVRLADIRDAVEAGADEIDVVLNRAAFVSGDLALARSELVAMREAVGDRAMKVIIEIDELGSLAAIREATNLTIEIGAEWVKTSTGKAGGGATPDGVATMAQAIASHQGGDTVGLKISGGVREADTALGYLSIVREILGDDWLTPARLRFGASGLVRSIVADLALTESDLAAGSTSPPAD